MSTQPPELLRSGLENAAGTLVARGLAVPPVRGKLLRPLVAWAFVPPELRDGLEDRFWLAALAVQMVHEASLLHDDIVDGALLRRGVPTMLAAEGVGPAILVGDHWLTAAYRAAALVGSPAFLDLFIEAVEQTVAGERRQGATAGRALSLEEYREVAAAKAGELFGAAAAVSPCLRREDPSEQRALGRRLGAIYQMLDDFLDYCPGTSGEQCLQDYRQGRWTWVLAAAEIDGFDAPAEEVMIRLLRPHPGGSAMERALRRFERECGALRADHERLVDGDRVLPEMLRAWVDLATHALHRTAMGASRSSRRSIILDGGTPVERERQSAAL